MKNKNKKKGLSYKAFVLFNNKCERKDLLRHLLLNYHNIAIMIMYTGSCYWPPPPPAPPAPPPALTVATHAESLPNVFVLVLNLASNIADKHLSVLSG